MTMVRHSLIVLFVLMISGAAYAQQYTKLYYPESNEPPVTQQCTEGGSMDFTPRDEYETGTFNFSSEGPISYEINGQQMPSSVSAGPLSGKVCADPGNSAFPQPGDSVEAKLMCSYTVTYSSPADPLYPPHGGPDATNVNQSTGATWSCGGSQNKPCAGGHTAPAIHTLVTETGDVTNFFLVMAEEIGEVRLQVQTGKDNIASVPLKAIAPKNYVTKDQGYQGLDKLFKDGIANNADLNNNQGAFRTAIINMSKKIKGVQGGLPKGQNQTTLQELFMIGKKQYRVDLEVIRGTNFKD
jgi:hypothetical protein